MAAVYGWVRNIIYYMIFLSVVNNLLADSKYEKYIRFFAGMVLILLVVSPLSGGLGLEEHMASLFRTISFENDANDLKTQFLGMEDKRLSQVIGKYEEAVEHDLVAMAEEDGLACVSAQVHIDGRRDSPQYGQVQEIELVLAEGAGGDAGNVVSKPVNVDSGDVDSIEFEPVRLKDEDVRAGTGKKSGRAGRRAGGNAGGSAGRRAGGRAGRSADRRASRSAGGRPGTVPGGNRGRLPGRWERRQPQDGSGSRLNSNQPFDRKGGKVLWAGRIAYQSSVGK